MRVYHFLILLSFLLFAGCSNKNHHLAVKQWELTENKKVHLTQKYGESIYKTEVTTKGYKTLRIFAHILNEAYKSKPLPENSDLKIIAYYKIGQGGWGYFEKTFNYKSTSGWGGVADIPIIGEKTQIAIYAHNMKDSNLKVDVVASLF